MIPINTEDNGEYFSRDVSTINNEITQIKSLFTVSYYSMMTFSNESPSLHIPWRRSGDSTYRHMETSWEC